MPLSPKHCNSPATAHSSFSKPSNRSSIMQLRISSYRHSESVHTLVNCEQPCKKKSLNQSLPRRSISYNKPNMPSIYVFIRNLLRSNRAISEFRENGKRVSVRKVNREKQIRSWPCHNKCCELLLSIRSILYTSRVLCISFIQNDFTYHRSCRTSCAR